MEPARALRRARKSKAIHETRVVCQVQYSPIVLCCMRFVNKLRKPFLLPDRTESRTLSIDILIHVHTARSRQTRNVQTPEAYNDLFAGRGGEKQSGRHAVRAVDRAVPCGERDPKASRERVRATHTHAGWVPRRRSVSGLRGRGRGLAVAVACAQRGARPGGALRARAPSLRAAAAHGWGPEGSHGVRRTSRCGRRGGSRTGRRGRGRRAGSSRRCSSRAPAS